MLSAKENYEIIQLSEGSRTLYLKSKYNRDDRLQRRPPIEQSTLQRGYVVKKARTLQGGYKDFSCHAQRYRHTRHIGFIFASF